jgi:hypothetical protein
MNLFTSTRAVLGVYESVPFKADPSWLGCWTSSAKTLTRTFPDTRAALEKNWIWVPDPSLLDVWQLHSNKNIQKNWKGEPPSPEKT